MRRTSRRERMAAAEEHLRRAEAAEEAMEAALAAGRAPCAICGARRASARHRVFDPELGKNVRWVVCEDCR